MVVHGAHAMRVADDGVDHEAVVRILVEQQVRAGGHRPALGPPLELLVGQQRGHDLLHLGPVLLGRQALGPQFAQGIDKQLEWGWRRHAHTPYRRLGLSARILSTTWGVSSSRPLRLATSSGSVDGSVWP